MSLAAKLLEIGKALLSRDGQRQEGVDRPDLYYVQAVEWLQKAFGVAEPLSEVETPGAAELKVTSNSI